MNDDHMERRRDMPRGPSHGWTAEVASMIVRETIEMKRDMPSGPFHGWMAEVSSSQIGTQGNH
jgi:hypothetical protein